MPDENWGPWVRQSKLGGGSNGSVYMVYREEQPREKFVLKTPRFNYPTQEKDWDAFLQKTKVVRFQREVEVLKQLKPHPNLVKLEDSNTTELPFYLVMPMVTDTDLDKKKELLQRMTIEQKLALFIPLCEAVGVVHALNRKKPVVHRDIKPNNILVVLSPEGAMERLILADFGLVTSLDPEVKENVTKLGANVGPANFIAPECLDMQDEKITPAADVYSLCKVLYWMLSNGRLLGGSHRDARYDLTRKGYPQLELINRILDEGLKTEPSERPSNAELLARQVVRVHGGLSDNAPSDWDVLKKYYLTLEANLHHVEDAQEKLQKDRRIDGTTVIRDRLRMARRSLIKFVTNMKPYLYSEYFSQYDGTLTELEFPGRADIHNVRKDGEKLDDLFREIQRYFGLRDPQYLNHLRLLAQGEVEVGDVYYHDPAFSVRHLDVLHWPCVTDQ